MAPEPGYEIGRRVDGVQVGDGLTERERVTLRMLKAGKTRSDVQVALDVSRERVRQLVVSLEQKGHTVPRRKYTRQADTVEGSEQ